METYPPAMIPKNPLSAQSKSQLPESRSDPLPYIITTPCARARLNKSANDAVFSQSLLLLFSIASGNHSCILLILDAFYHS